MTKERLIEHLSHLMRLGAQNPDLSDRGEWLLTALQERGLTIVSSASETGVVYHKWPGEPPHCMSCDCGMTDEQKRTVPFEDYQTFHTALMAIVYESKSFAEAVKLASDALSHKPAQESGQPATRSRRQIDGAAPQVSVERDDIGDLLMAITTLRQKTEDAEVLAKHVWDAATAQKASSVRDQIAPNNHCPKCDRWFWADKFEGHDCRPLNATAQPPEQS